MMTIAPTPREDGIAPHAHHPQAALHPHPRIVQIARAGQGAAAAIVARRAPRPDAEPAIALEAGQLVEVLGASSDGAWLLIGSRGTDVEVWLPTRDARSGREVVTAHLPSLFRVAAEDGIALRDEPRADAPEVSRIEHGAILDVLAHRDGWILVHRAAPSAARDDPWWAKPLAWTQAQCSAEAPVLVHLKGLLPTVTGPRGPAGVSIGSFEATPLALYVDSRDGGLDARLTRLCVDAAAEGRQGPAMDGIRAASAEAAPDTRALLARVTAPRLARAPAPRQRANAPRRPPPLPSLPALPKPAPQPGGEGGRGRAGATRALVRCAWFDPAPHAGAPVSCLAVSRGVGPLARLFTGADLSHPKRDWPTDAPMARVWDISSEHFRAASPPSPGVPEAPDSGEADTAAPPSHPLARQSIGGGVVRHIARLSGRTLACITADGTLLLRSEVPGPAPWRSVPLASPSSAQDPPSNHPNTSDTPGTGACAEAAPSPSPSPSPSPASNFVAARGYRGARPGFVFRVGEWGMGYYRRSVLRDVVTFPPNDAEGRVVLGSAAKLKEERTRRSRQREALGRFLDAGAAAHACVAIPWPVVGGVGVETERKGRTERKGGEGREGGEDREGEEGVPTREAGAGSGAVGLRVFQGSRGAEDGVIRVFDYVQVSAPFLFPFPFPLAFHECSERERQHAMRYDAIAHGVGAPMRELTPKMRARATGRRRRGRGGRGGEAGAHAEGTRGGGALPLRRCSQPRKQRRECRAAAPFLGIVRPHRRGMGCARWTALASHARPHSGRARGGMESTRRNVRRDLQRLLGQQRAGVGCGHGCVPEDLLRAARAGDLARGDRRVRRRQPRRDCIQGPLWCNEHQAVVGIRRRCVGIA